MKAVTKEQARELLKSLGLRPTSTQERIVIAWHERVASDLQACLANLEALTQAHVAMIDRALDADSNPGRQGRLMGGAPSRCPPSS